MSKEITNSVKRDYFSSSPEAVSEHLKAVGEAIIKDAEQICLEPSNITSIKISAEIAPCTELTYITYEIDRRADPRIPDRYEDE